MKDSPRDFHIFVPLFFDSESFAQLRGKLKAVFPEGYRPLFHVLDDSAGADPKILPFASMSDVSVHTMPSHLGHQRALVYGLRSFLGSCREEDLILVMDGDGQDSPEDVPRMIEAFLGSRPFQPVVLAVRSGRSEGLCFRLLHWWYQLLFRVLTGNRFNTGNFLLFSSSWGKENISHHFFDKSFASSILALAEKKVFVPSRRGPRYSGQSKMNYPALFLHGMRMLAPFSRKILWRFCYFVLGMGALYLALVCLRT
jgi:polyisoprenyl-phosphate glycosyltransferase